MAAQREWFEKDYYDVLGVPEGSTDKELARAYKKLAKQYHPDANHGDKDAEERFKEISAAYDVLGDATKRKEYDEVRRMVASGAGPRGGFGPGGPGGFGGGGQTFRFETDGDGGFLNDLLGGMFGGGAGGGRRGRRGGGGATAPQRGQDLETELFLSFDDAVKGVTSTVRFRSDAVCHTCHGNGAAPGTSPETCPQCHGSGSIAVDQGPFSFSQVCPTCGGRGQVIPTPCPTCHGRGVEVRDREVKVRVPVGVADGQRIRVQGPRRRGRDRWTVRRSLCRRARAAPRALRTQRQRPVAARSGHLRGSGARRGRAGSHPRRSGDRADPGRAPRAAR